MIQTQIFSVHSGIIRYKFIINEKDCTKILLFSRVLVSSNRKVERTVILRVACDVEVTIVSLDKSREAMYKQNNKLVRLKVYF